MEKFITGYVRIERRRERMNTKLDKYLDTVDRHLQPLPASERVDIVKEIKGSMIEMEKWTASGFLFPAGR